MPIAALGLVPDRLGLGLAGLDFDLGRVCPRFRVLRRFSFFGFKVLLSIWVERDNPTSNPWKRASSAGLGMDQECQLLNCWESQQLINACRAASGVSPDQHERWAGWGLIPGARQIPLPGKGSFVVYTPGTCAQLAAAARLFKEKSLREYVGKMLWWEGYPVNETYWVPQLAGLAKRLDRLFALLGPLTRRHNRESATETLGDRLARSEISDTIGTRIKRRLATEDLAQLFGTMADIAMGEGIGIQIPSTPPPNRPSHAETRKLLSADWMVRAFDINGADRDSVLGNKFTFRKALPDILASLSLAFSTGSFSDLTRDRAAILRARDDFRNALSIGADLHSALKDIYGDQAFGLRLVAWIANKKPELAIAAGILSFARLRQIPNDLYSSTEIAEMAIAARRCRDNGARIRHLRLSEPKLKEVLAPKRIKAALQDQISYKLWLQDCRHQIKR